MNDFISGAILGGGAVLIAIYCGWIIAIKGAEKTRKEFEDRLREEKENDGKEKAKTSESTD